MALTTIGTIVIYKQLDNPALEKIHYETSVDAFPMSLTISISWMVLMLVIPLYFIMEKPKVRRSTHAR